MAQPEERIREGFELPSPTDTPQLELTVLMPCLNEAETLASCIRKSKRFLTESNIDGEVLIADNGSTDGSQDIARAEGAEVLDVSMRGYGAALLGGIAAAKGRFVIMGDADDSYDFSALQPFMNRLRAGSQLVMGNRFKGGIAPGAMPFLHKYFGNPVLSWLGRLFFNIDAGDFHCGLRGFETASIRRLGLRTTGMEFASEMLVRSALAGYRIDEAPTTLRPDGRSRPPHLRPWRDGWRHLSFLLMYSPRWLFFYPGVFLLTTGVAGAILLLPGPVRVGTIHFDLHTFLVACIAVLLGTQSISFALIARQFATAHGLTPPSKRFGAILDDLTLERLLVAGGVVATVGIVGFVWCIVQWASAGFGVLQYAQLVRVLTLSLTALAIGFQLALAAFLSAITAIPTR
ncbi:glycosyltransferase family 2 protein [Mesorhizobium sp. KR9-304]|uniref:glycosyltransferase family 2 protein n=1 Tax=Mesorhizobium sp. KR9-304 TaxID=3156614 RepID=UPI0032B5FFAB